MEFNEKLQELRKNKNLTQEDLAKKLYVSRTAISKWESGRGYPSIDSLKAIANFFSISLDELLSTNEALTIAQEDNKEKQNRYRDLIYGVIDMSYLMLLFLPFFGSKINGEIKATSLLSLVTTQPYLKILYLIFVSSAILIGVLTLALQNINCEAWSKTKSKVSLILTVALILLFIISQQPYSAVFCFATLIIKSFLVVNRK